MTDRELEHKVYAALEHAAPDDLDGVLSRCQPQVGAVTPMTNRPARAPGARRYLAWLTAACMALILVGGGFGLQYQQAHAVASVVSLDVNPSFELKVNKDKKVLSCAALNEDAVRVLGDMDLNNVQLDVAVNAIVGALVRSGYLDSISSTILISVEDKDQDRAAKLQQELTVAVDTVLQQQSANAAVLSQTVPQDDGLAQLATANSISTGKAALVNQLLTMNSALDTTGLSALSVEELKNLAETGAPGMPIGKDEAILKAMIYAGVAHLSSVSFEADPELDETPACYEVELKTPYGEFEYRVDAYTGQVLSGQANVSSHGGKGSSMEETPIPGTAPGAIDIGPDTAKSAALRHAGLAESAVTSLRVKQDYDDGRLEYEVEFRSGGMEYEYTIDGATGTVLEHESERDDHS